MKLYLDLLRLPGVVRLMSSALVGRFQYGLMSVSFLLFFYDKYGSYAIASLALGAETIGVGISGPWLGRQLVNWGPRRVVSICSVLAGCLVTFLILVDLPAWLGILLALLIGLSTPPVQQTARLLFEPLAGEKNLKTIFTFDAISQELIWVFGPVVATLLAATINPSASMWAIVITGQIGVFWFITHPKFKALKLDRHEQRIGGVLKNSKFILILLLGLLLIGGFAGVEIGTIGAVDRTAAGLALAMFSVGSIIGGLAFGHRAKTQWALSKYAAVVVFGYSLSLVMPSNPWWLAFCWTIAGLGVAPMLGLLSLLISKLLSPSAAAEGYGWMGTGQLVGYSAAAAVCGLALDFSGASLTFTIGVILGAVTVLVAILARNALPSPESKQA
jgi:predicted MFS family arabinose efflux permease